MFAFTPLRKSRKPALTPLIDVVFLLLVFFMLAAQFGREGALDLLGGGGADYTGPPRVITILPDGILLNGVPSAEADLPDALAQLIESREDLIVIRARDGASVQRLADVTGQLTNAGFTRLTLVE
ncbi:MAG: biopolymer transporter ExbD [Pseudomonadota bacterium]